MTILATVIVLGVLIFVHELGHFLAARSVGVRVERFSIGLGPRLFGFRRGDTEYVISAIPLGGYVKMGGMDDEVMEAIEGGEGKEPRTPSTSDYDSKPVWARAWVISAGVIANMLFAFATYAVVAIGWGQAHLDTTRIGYLSPAAIPAEASGWSEIPAGAELRQIGDRSVSHWGDVQSALRSHPAGSVAVAFDGPTGSVQVVIPADSADRARLMQAVEYWALPVVHAVEPGGPAGRAGLQPGDRILSIDGDSVRSWQELVRAVQARPEQPTQFTILRDGGELVRTITPNAGRGQDAVTGEPRTVGLIGVAGELPGVAYDRVAAASALGAAWDETAFWTTTILGFLRDLVTGQISPRNLGSIVTIGEASGQAAAEGIPVFLRFMAFFSINLAILNLLPIPVLDGGHLLFLGIEAIRGRPLSVKQRLRWSQVGFVVLIGIMVLALGNDFLRLVGL